MSSGNYCYGCGTLPRCDCSVEEVIHGELCLTAGIRQDDGEESEAVGVIRRFLVVIL